MKGESDRMPEGAALVTGGAKGIGRRIAERLAEAGYALVLHCSGRSQAEAEQAAHGIRSKGGKVQTVFADFNLSAGVEALIDKARACFGPLDLLVNNAGIFTVDEASNFDVVTLDRQFAINFKAPLILSRDFARQLPPGQEGVIINILDQRVFRLTPQFFTYSLSKSALWTATQTMAQTYAGQGIRVNAVGPGPVSPNEPQGERGFAHEVQGLPLARAVSGDEIADAVLYLAKARNVTGQMIAVDAGQHLAWQTPDIVL
ncbi:MAG: SDR family oxidoreductase [Alphaproteobacteria bacterium]|nr:SDR family oxidoreductase [Alphaproteobacteria bacterium]